MDKSRKPIRTIVATGVAIILLLLVAGTIYMSHAARLDTERAIRKVSLLYLDELAGRREQVVEANLDNRIETIEIAVGLMTDEDLATEENRQAYQARMKALYHLDKFAFVGESGTIYKATGQSDDEINNYSFDYKNMTGPDISILNLNSEEKKVVIAVPIEPKDHLGDKLVVCFMEMDMEQMLHGVSMESSEDNATFCNLYTSSGYPLSNAVLGGFATEDNLLVALEHAEFEGGYTLDKVKDDFANCKEGEVSFTYNDTEETLTYVPVENTDWLLTYLVRESFIGDQISDITKGTLIRSTIQSLLTILALLLMFMFIIRQNRKNAKILADHEASEAEARVRQEEMEHRLELQGELLAQKQQSEQQDVMIKSLSSDYRSVYYVDLDKNEGVCYQARTDLPGFKEGDEFNYLNAVTSYCNHYIMEEYREPFLEFVQIENVREALKDHPVISYRYMIEVDGKQTWESVKFAGVEEEEEEKDHAVRKVGACFVDIDDETKNELETRQALTDALKSAEEANKAKTAFLSSMSHEIRTPMNAIIGLDNIALNDPETPDKTKEYLEKIGASAEHLLHLINDILDMSRIESGRMVIKNEEFAFSELLEMVNTMFSGQCADKGLEYQCHINGEVDHYYVGDKMKLRQVLINILGNAVKFTPEGGKVDLTVERTAKYENKSALRFTIADTGIGMSKEYLPKLFDTFTQEDSSMTNKYGSSGLGMAITKSIVEMMNGHIEVESEKGKGTTFYVTVTLMNAAEHEDAGTGKDIRPEDMTVLVVDDDPVACEHAKLILEKAGIASEIAMSGPEAIEKTQLRHARRDPYNLILVDWKMPGMDGIETTRRMREIIGHESAIIILTAYRWDDVADEALAAGVDSFLPKPLFANSVMEEFKSAMHAKGIITADKIKVDLEGRHILLAEDVEINAEIMMMVLAARGMDADLAVNGKIAVEKFEASEPGHYDAILMDMRMPEMDGLEATRRIRAMERPDAKEIPIIALTANAFDEDVQRSLQAGLDAHLSKPVQPESLYETLESLIKD
ncbi:MAG: response regulator [Mogibacterium sp.]|nr:response regulator [Mogibacterium sp.]